MKKRIVCAVLPVCLLLPLAGFSAFADGEGIAVTVNGETVSVHAGETLFAVCEELGKQLVYAEVTDGDGTAVHVTDPAFVVEPNMTLRVLAVSLVMESDAEVRQVLPSGVRFLTRLSQSDLDLVSADDKIKEIKIGTLIRPVDLLEDGVLTHPAEKELCLDVPATPDAPYQKDGDALLFAGSVVSVKEKNHSRLFAGRGYMSVTLTDGKTATVYASGTLPTDAYGCLAAELLRDETVELTDLAKGFFKDVANTMYTTDLAALDVLAIGDSLFDGDFLRGHEQWIGVLGRQCVWNLTNLGRDGWTVAYNPEAYEDSAKVRQSMYHNLFNNSQYRYGGDGSYSRGAPYGKEGSDVDVILLEGGTNDYGWGIPLGDVDSKDGGTLLGAWNLMIEKLLTDYPNATIVLVTSWHNTGTRQKDGASRMDFVADGMKAIYEAHYASNERVQLIDAGDPAVTGINMSDNRFRTQYSKSVKDVNHLNAEGMQMMADAMLPLLWETLCKAK